MRHKPLPPDELTVRELDVLRLVVYGLSNRAIAMQLTIAEKTVEYHLTHILAKLGVKKRTQVWIPAVQRGLIRLDAPGDFPDAATLLSL